MRLWIGSISVVRRSVVTITHERSQPSSPPSSAIRALVGDLPHLPQPGERQRLAVAAVDEVRLLLRLARLARLPPRLALPRLPLVEAVGRDQAPLLGEGPAVRGLLATVSARALIIRSPILTLLGPGGHQAPPEPGEDPLVCSRLLRTTRTFRRGPRCSRARGSPDRLVDLVDREPVGDQRRRRRGDEAAAHVSGSRRSLGLIAQDGRCGGTRNASPTTCRRSPRPCCRRARSRGRSRGSGSPTGRSRHPTCASATRSTSPPSNSSARFIAGNRRVSSPRRVTKNTSTSRRPRAAVRTLHTGRQLEVVAEAVRRRHDRHVGCPRRCPASSPTACRSIPPRDAPFPTAPVESNATMRHERPLTLGTPGVTR